MVRKCAIKLCTSADDISKCTFFKVPKTSVNIWTDIISKVNGFATKVNFVCEKHFKPDDFLNNYSGWSGYNTNDEVC